jgi:hypothetical protein
MKLRFHAEKLSRRAASQPRWRVGVILAFAVFGSGVSAFALITAQGDRTIVQNVEGTAIGAIGGHIVQSTLTNQVIAGAGAEAFELAFERGDELFSAKFNAADGGGANVGQGSRFTRMPRADLNAAGQWGQHVPSRATGPNATNCTGCHDTPVDDGAGDAAGNVHRDALHTGRLNQMVTRNAPHVMGLGALQKLAEEMTTDLQNLRNTNRTAIGCGSTTTAGSRTVTLTSKGINFGTLVINHAAGTTACTETLNAPVAGGARSLSADLIIRPYQWKGSVAFVRDFVRGAAHNELGMQGSEIVGSPTVDPATVDGDGDGVRNELFVGDITALTIYQAAQARPSTNQELASLGLIPPLTSAQNSDIAAGSTVFDAVGCNSCHVRTLTANDIIFREPSNNPNFRDSGNVFPNGRSYGNAALDVAHPVSFDLTRDALENADIILPNGQKLGAFTRDAQNRAVINLFGDLRRHDMGAGLNEEVDEVGTGRSVFMTENLWGCGSTAPYLHDGRAVTLTEAILEHGGEGQTSRNNFAARSTTDQRRLVAFLNNLVLFKAED